MLTYQDLLAVGENEKKRIDFVFHAIYEHINTSDYKKAVDYELYYNGENPTINRFEKIIYDMQGIAHKDMWTANHKIASSFFRFVVDQEVSYLLSNGINFKNKDTKSKLGKAFDEDVCDLLEYARVMGTSFGFWNVDHIDIFKLTEFVPLYDEKNSALAAGIRFWQLDENKPLIATLYEMSGLTTFIWYERDENGNKKNSGRILEPKSGYNDKIVGDKKDKHDGTEEIRNGENYPSLPIVPMFSDKEKKSAMNGKRNTLDALDLAMSNMVNNVDEGNLIYWVLNNCNGMDDVDDAEFIDRLRTTRVAHANGDSGANAVPHTIEAPFQGTNATIDMLINRLYDDFQAFNAAAVSASNQSATAIKASYVPLDLKTDKIERQVTRFIKGILKFAGIDDTPTYTRNQLINKSEEVQSLVMQAQFLDEEYIRQKLLTLNGDIDQYEEISRRIDAENMNRLNEVQ